VETQGCPRGDVDHVWSRARQAVLARDGWICVVCETTDWNAELQVHHRAPVGPLGYGPSCAHHRDGLITLCRAHHRAMHRPVTWRPQPPEVSQEQLRLPVAV
jgi:predicted HNH restriction endonuclease